MCDPCSFIMICLSKVVCVSISSSFMFCLLAFLWYLPFSIVFYSMPECLTTLITDYSACLLLCYLACHAFQGYFVVSFLFHRGMFPIPFSKVFLLSSFRLSILSQGTLSFIWQFVYMFSQCFYGEGCHSCVD